MKGGVRISLLGGALLLFDFEESFDTNMELSRGLRRYKDKVLHPIGGSQRWGVLRKHG